MRLLKRSLAALVLLAAVQASFGFALLGPFAAWQTATYSGSTIGYNLAGDIGAPRTPGEGYRWNVPLINYAFDQTFINYFGTNGIKAVEQAVEMVNGLPPMSQITNDSSHLYIRGQRVPMQTKRVNYLSQSLGLMDIRSVALSLLVEELGLAEAERYVWTLGGRNVSGNPAITNYTVLKNNFDPISIQPSSFVNGTIYSYDIVEVSMPNQSDAVEFPLNPLDFAFTSVSSGFGVGGLGLSISLGVGEFYTGLTHDDVGGLRWLYSTNRMFVESLVPNVTGGRPFQTGGGGSPWGGFLTISNFFVGSSNAFFNTNVVNIGTNLTNGLIVTGLRPGLNQIKFQRVNYDSLLGQAFVPITNRFTDTTITNSRAVIQPLQRALLAPDIVFTAERLGLSLNSTPFISSRTATAAWQNNDAVNGQDTEVDGGPGVIVPPIKIAFSDQLPFYLNTSTFFLGESGATRSIIWASFDGSTNQPVIYPVYGELTVQSIRRELGL